MALPLQTLRDLRAFLLSDYVSVKGTQIPLVNSFVQALVNEEQAQLAQQAVRERTAPIPAAVPPSQVHVGG